VVGERVFSHESGLHVDGVIKNPLNYEGFDPAEVGLMRHLVIGKHSGGHGLIERLHRLGVEIDRDEAEKMMRWVRALSQRLKRPLEDEELLRLWHGPRRVA